VNKKYLKNYLGLFSFLLLFLFFKISSAGAFCPVCVVAVGAGLELSHYLGIDDTVTGLWVGAFLVALSAWTLEWLKKKQIKFKGEGLIIFLAYYALTIIPLYWAGLMGQYGHTFWGIDKLLLGIIFGSVIFYAGGIWNLNLKKNNNNKVYFPFQKVIIPVGMLLILSFIFYFLTK
jgi:hypothetical protein